MEARLVQPVAVAGPELATDEVRVGRPHRLVEKKTRDGGGKKPPDQRGGAPGSCGSARNGASWGCLGTDMESPRKRPGGRGKAFGPVASRFVNTMSMKRTRTKPWFQYVDFLPTTPAPSRSGRRLSGGRPRRRTAHGTGRPESPRTRNGGSRRGGTEGGGLRETRESRRFPGPLPTRGNVGRGPAPERVSRPFSRSPSRGRTRDRPPAPVRCGRCRRVPAPRRRGCPRPCREPATSRR